MNSTHNAIFQEQEEEIFIVDIFTKEDSKRSFVENYLEQGQGKVKFLEKVSLDQQLSVLKLMRHAAANRTHHVHFEEPVDDSSDSISLVNKKEVIITENQGVKSFFVRYSYDYNNFHEMQTMLNCISSESLQDFRSYPSQPQIGDRVLYIDEDNGKFYRASFERVTQGKKSSDHEFTIVLIDVGKRIIITKDSEKKRLKVLDQRFLKYPALAKQYQLDGFDSADNSQWDLDNRREQLDFVFKMLSKGVKFEMEIKEKGNVDINEFL